MQRPVHPAVARVRGEHVVVEDDEVVAEPRDRRLKSPVRSSFEKRRARPARAVEVPVVELLVQILVRKVQSARAVGDRAQRRPVIDALRQRGNRSAPAGQWIRIASQPHLRRRATAMRAIEEHQPRAQADEAASSAIRHRIERWLLDERGAAVGRDGNDGSVGPSAVEEESLHPDAAQRINRDQSAVVGGRRRR